MIRDSRIAALTAFKIAFRNVKRAELAYFGKTGYFERDRLLSLQLVEDGFRRKLVYPGTQDDITRIHD